MNKAQYLLPAGFRDQLFDEAEAEFNAIKLLTDLFFKKGYRLATTPIVEFEDSLFAESGKSLEAKSFKLFDPISRKTLGVRADITTQIARFFLSRLEGQKLPVKVCYFGDILRQAPANTRADRQLKQVGLEYIDSKPSAAADAEVTIIAAEGLLKLGIKDITIDLHTPNLVSKLSEDEQKALQRRELAKLPADVAALCALSGNAEDAFKNAPKNEQIEYVREVYELIKKAKLGINLTADFVENKGFEYHNSYSFSVFGKNIRDEIGRGGRYNITSNYSATGFTIYINSIIDRLTAK